MSLSDLPDALPALTGLLGGLLGLWPDLAAWAQASPLLALGLVVAGLALVKVALTRGRDAPTAAPARGRFVVERPGVPWWDYLLPRRRRVPWRIGRRVVDLHGRHGAALGATGSGKSTVLCGLVDGRAPTLILACDRSDPLRSRVEAVGGVVWRPDGTLGWDLFQGSARDVARRLTAAFASNSQADVYRKLARTGATVALGAMDAARERRGLPALIERMRVVNARGLQAAMLEGWLGRWEDLCHELGPALGDDLDLADCLRHGDTVLLELDTFRAPGTTDDLVAMAMMDVLRCAADVSVPPFRLLIDEGGQLSKRRDVLEAIFRAGRARGVSVAIATQYGGDLAEIVRQNCSVWVLFAQNELGAARWCADQTGVAPADFLEGRLPRLRAYVLADGRVSRERLARPRLRPLPAPAAVTTVGRAAPQMGDGRDGGRAAWTVDELLPELDDVDESGEPAGGAEEATDDRPAWARTESGERVWSKLAFPDGLSGCWLWTAAVDNGGYGKVTVRGKTWRAHRWVWEQARGEALGEMDLDHVCPVDVPPHTCCNPDHLEPVTTDENSKRRWARRTAVSLGRPYVVPGRSGGVL